MAKDSGHYVCYQPMNFGDEAVGVIKTANDIIEEYESRGMAITLRQLYYQFVARDAFPPTRRYVSSGGKWIRDADGTPNAEPNYTWLGGLISNGRMAGLVSWTSIEDRGRSLKGLRTQESPATSIRAALAEYRIDKWEGQDWRPEVWVEKAALEGVLESICNELQVDFFACRGYNSQSEQWRAGRRMARHLSRGQRPIVFHLGDHDPSGIDMTRDNQERLSLFCGVQVQVVRIALNMAQVRQYDPPPNPAKVTDSRFADYQRLHGDESWELDALEPTVIRELIRDAVVSVRDPKKWDDALAREAEDKVVLSDMVDDMEEREGGRT